MPAITIYQQTDFDDKDGIWSFLQAHASRHRLYNIATESMNLSFPRSDFNSYPDDDWFQRHYTAHATLAQLVIPNPGTDLSVLTDASWDNQNDFSIWMQMHTQIHQQIDQHFGMV